MNRPQENRLTTGRPESHVAIAAKRVTLMIAFACFTILSEGLLAAQESSTRSDTAMIAALKAMAPGPSLGTNTEPFDRLVGTWDFDCVATAEDGTISKFKGKWIFGWVLDGRALQDVWIGYENASKQTDRSIGTTLRFYDSKLKQWRVIFVVPESGKILQLTGGPIGDRIVFEGLDVDGSRLRWSFNNLLANSLLWRGETSSDNGKTWRVEEIMRLRRRAT